MPAGDWFPRFGCADEGFDCVTVERLVGLVERFVFVLERLLPDDAGPERFV